MLYIGIDLGTSAVKLLLMNEAGQILNVCSKAYPLEFPKPGWSQQNPEDWRRAVWEGIPVLLEGFDRSQVRRPRRRFLTTRFHIWSKTTSMPNVRSSAPSPETS